MTDIQNPILPGFHPDPSIIRVGEDYYIATSTFEWYPGVCIYHSKDLQNWRLVAQPLNRLSQLDMRGNPDSCGVWAPCLSYADGVFYLAFTNVRRFAGDMKDTHNYFVTTRDIMGHWSEPTYLNSSGFDPSLYHEGDKTYLLNMVWNHLPTTGRNNWLPHKYFGGILLQELDRENGTLLGQPKRIFTGSDIGLAEGPHLYKRQGYYYLMVAEGGTGRDHAVTIARSRTIDGPYSVDPQGPLLTSVTSPLHSLKRAGHGDWIESPTGDCYLVHLCSRPLPYRGRSVMGRETAIQRLNWRQDGWPRLAHNGHHPVVDVASHLPSVSPSRVTAQRVEFDGSILPLDFQTLRYPLPSSVMNQTQRPGYLRLVGKESLGSWFEQALLARRQQAFMFTAETCVDFNPQSSQHMAGLVCYYNSKKYYYLHITHNCEQGRVLDVSMCVNSWHSQYPMSESIPLPSTGEVRLRAEVNYDRLIFSYAIDGDDWTVIPGTFDYSILSDEMGEAGGTGTDANFTGAFVGICCQDLQSQQQHADFAYFDYREGAE